MYETRIFVTAAVSEPRCPSFARLELCCIVLKLCFEQINDDDDDDDDDAEVSVRVGVNGSLVVSSQPQELFSKRLANHFSKSTIAYRRASQTTCP